MINHKCNKNIRSFIWYLKFKECGISKHWHREGNKIHLKEKNTYQL